MTAKTAKTAKQRSAKTWVLAAVGFVVLSSSTAGPEQGSFSPTMIQYQIDSVSLDALAGYYRFPNRAAYVRFFDQDGQFVVQQTWDGRIYPLHRTGSLSFQSRDEAYQIAFIEGAEGKIDKVKILDRVILEKVPYNPTQYVELSAEQLTPLLGRYRFQKDSNMEINVSIQDGKLAVKQLWDNNTISFEAYSPTDFFNEELTFPLTFIVENGVVRNLICFELDNWKKEEHE